jgi:3-isopropylmalate/(R)-2-methylmalate dehydratase small subunit
VTEGSSRITAVEGTALPLRGDDIDTDRIIPARYLRTVSFEGIERHVFEDDRSAALTAGRSAALAAGRNAAAHPFDDPRFSGARVLIVQGNFGCGSSREHAPQAIYRWGIQAIVGESFSDIFFGNAALIGLPCVSATRADVDALMAFIEQHPGSPVKVDLVQLTCETDAFVCPVRLPAAVRDAFVSGTWDTTGLLLERYDDVRAVAGRLPYLTGFGAARRD